MMINYKQEDAMMLLDQEETQDQLNQMESEMAVLVFLDMNIPLDKQVS